MKKILIVEDNVPMRYLLETILKKSYNVRSADDGLTAMMLLSQGFVPDLILTDINMPSINGWELIVYLKKSILYKNIPIVVLSSSQLEDVALATDKDLIHGCIKKPFEPVNLLQHLSGVLKTSNYLSAVPVKE
ncbi:response regulator [Danxiaibacter flavus]|uniref:Response regulator n=1 Tax=Danxiaibacter flavus TaxID=3049108 RepID=A0ABV3ZE66_9BACT|nr:response regulator [Chitinophagaceae bacterium DXS]